MNKEKKKRKYQKPKLESIHLLAEEVLTTGCKTFLTSGATTTPCGSGTSPCGSEGS